MKKLYSLVIFVILLLFLTASISHAKDCYLKDSKTGTYECVDNKYPKHHDRKEKSDKRKVKKNNLYPFLFWSTNPTKRRFGMFKKRRF